MARRSAPSAQPSYLPHPHNRKALADPNESAFARFIRTEIVAPEKVSGNIGVLTGVSMFIGGIVAIRSFGELMIPA